MKHDFISVQIHRRIEKFFNLSSFGNFLWSSFCNDYMYCAMSVRDHKRYVRESGRLLSAYGSFGQDFEKVIRVTLWILLNARLKNLFERSYWKYSSSIFVCTYGFTHTYLLMIEIDTL